MKSYKTIRALLRDLRELCPPLLPVVYRSRVLTDCSGYCRLIYDDEEKPSHFVIVLDSRLSLLMKKELLLHEWAHVLSWQDQPNHCSLEDHGPEWGLAYSRVYQEICEP